MIQIQMTNRSTTENTTVIGSEVTLSASAVINRIFERMLGGDIVKAELMALAFADAVIDLSEHLSREGINLRMVGGVRSELANGQTCLHVIMTGQPEGLKRLRSKLKFYDGILTVEVAARMSAVVP